MKSTFLDLLLNSASILVLKLNILLFVGTGINITAMTQAKKTCRQVIYDYSLYYDGLLESSSFYLILNVFPMQGMYSDSSWLYDTCIHPFECIKKSKASLLLLSIKRLST
jgi:hypothetical protein